MSDQPWKVTLVGGPGDGKVLEKQEGFMGWAVGYCYREETGHIKHATYRYTAIDEAKREMTAEHIES